MLLFLISFIIFCISSLITHFLITRKSTVTQSVIASFGGGIFITVAMVSAYYAIQEHDLDIRKFAIVFVGVIWVLYVLIKNSIKNNPILLKQSKMTSIWVCLVISCAISSLFTISWTYVIPSNKDLSLKVKEAEDKYFLLSAGSIDHKRICKAALKAKKLNQRLGDQKRVELFNHFLIQDKCL